MRRMMFFSAMLCLAAFAVAGFNPKIIKSKKPEQFHARSTVSGITFAADLLLKGKDQEDFFYRDLTPCNVIALRLAIFNNSLGEVVVPLKGIQLIGPDGKELPLADPKTVAQAALQGFVVSSGSEQPPVRVDQTSVGSSRIDKTAPDYDPRLDPADPSYDPTDPRNSGYGRGTYDSRRPGVGVVLNPSGGKYSGVSAQLIEKDFEDKSHSGDPISPSLVRDRFLYFSFGNLPGSVKGFVLRLPRGRGYNEEVMLKF